MTKIALLGAGGKMGVRLATNLKGTRFDVDHVEISAEGRERLKQALKIVGEIDLILNHVLGP